MPGGDGADSVDGLGDPPDFGVGLVGKGMEKEKKGQIPPGPRET